MAELVHTSKIRIHQDERPQRRAFFDGFEDPVYFGVHGGIKHFYGLEPRQDQISTLDYMIAAVAG